MFVYSADTNYTKCACNVPGKFCFVEFKLWLGRCLWFADECHLNNYAACCVGLIKHSFKSNYLVYILSNINS